MAGSDIRSHCGRSPLDPPTTHGSGSAGGVARRLRAMPDPIKVYTRTGDDGTTGCSTGVASPRTAPGPRPTARPTNPSPPWVSPAPRPRPIRSSPPCSSGSNGSCSWWAPSWRRHRRTVTSSSPAPPGSSRRWSTRWSVTSTRPPSVSTRPRSSCCRARTGSRPRSTWRGRPCGAPSGSASPPRREGWLEADSLVIPYLNRLADLCWTLGRWQEGHSRAALAATAEPGGTRVDPAHCRIHRARAHPRRHPRGTGLRGPGARPRCRRGRRSHGWVPRVVHGTVGLLGRQGRDALRAAVRSRRCGPARGPGHRRRG